jgi:TRAP-type C4-dicarboxylate transport system substrate-binding protein
MKRNIGIPLALVLVAAPFASGAAETVTLKLGFPPPPVSHFYPAFLEPWSKEIEEATKGAVKVQIFPGGVLSTHRNGYDRILNGVADIGWGLHGILGKTFQKSSVTSLPGIQATGPQCTAAMWQLFATGVIADEYDKVRPLAFSCFPPTGAVSAKPLRSIDDFKGMKVSVTSRLYGQEVELLGAAPITLATTEIYQGLQRGTVDASIVGLAALAAYKLHEVARFYLDAPLGQTTHYMLMSKDSYAKLPAEARAVFDSKTGAQLSARMGKTALEEHEFGVRAVQEAPGHTVTAMAGGELARLQRMMAPVIDQWVKETPDGARVLASYKAEVVKAGAAR